MSAKTDLSANGWRQIKTVSPEGVVSLGPVLVWNGDWHKAKYVLGSGWVSENGVLTGVTHMMPLPLPPVSAGRAVA